MHKSFLKLLVAVAVAASFLTSAPSASAQGITTASVNGFVTSKDGKPVAGASVAVVHEPSGTHATTTTRTNGQYTLSGLRVGGPYTITVSSTGLKSESSSDIFLALGDTATYNYSMGPEEVLQLEKLSVFGSRDDTFGTGKIGTSTNFSSDDITNTPSVRRNIQDIAQLDSRITILSLDQGGQMSASGQNLRYNSFLVDGVQAVDPFGLNGNGFSSLRSPIPLEAIASLSVELNPYDVSRAGFTGALLNAVIKSGTNDFHGALYGEKTGQNWRAKNPVTGVRDVFDEKTWGFTFGGPIIQNKLFFFLAYDSFKRSASPPTQNFVPDATTLAAIVTRAQALGYDAGNTTAVNTSYQKTTIGKLDWNISDKHRLSYTYYKNDGQDTNFAEFTGTTTVSLSNYWFDQPRLTTSHTVQLFSNWTPDFRTEVDFVTKKYDGSPSNKGKPFPRVQVNGVAGTRLDNGLSATGTVVLGTELSRQLNFINTKENNGKISGQYSVGDHTLGFGLEDDVTSYTNKFVQNIMGNYTFPNLAAWQAGSPVSAFTLAKLNAGFTLDNAFAQWKYDARALFIEDTWRPNEQLTLLAGLRWDYPNVPDAPPKATGFDVAGFMSEKGHAVNDNTTTNNGNDTIAPRIGFSYQFKTARKTQLRGGIGLFQGKNPAVWISNAYSNSGALGNVSAATTGGVVPGFVFQPDVNAQVAPAGSPAAPNINVTDAGLKQPVSWKSNLALDHYLPGGDMVVTVEVNYLKVQQGLNTEYLNYQVATTGPTTMPDGRIRYNGLITPTGSFVVSGVTSLAQFPGATSYTASTGVLAFPSSSTGGRRHVNTGGPTGTGFADVFYLTNTTKGMSTDLTFQIRRPMKEHWAWSLSWTHNHSTEVSPMTSSTASSNYSNRASYNPNEDIASVSDYEIKDRIVATLTREFAFIKQAPTTVSLVFQARTGRPYSWIFRGDANGDGFTFNDEFYMPSGPSDPKVRFASQAESDAFYAFAASTDLMKYAGHTIPRNTEFSPWVSTVDLKFTQAVPLFKQARAELYVNVLNLAYLLNKKWGGLQEEVPFSYKRAVAGATFDSTANGGAGQWIYTFNSSTLDSVPTTVNDTPISRWQVQAGMRIRF